MRFEPNQKAQSTFVAWQASLLTEALTPTEDVKGARASQLASGEVILGTPEAVNSAAARVNEALIVELQKHLRSLEGGSFGMEANKSLAKSITALIRNFPAYAIECPHCQAPSYLAFARCGNSKGVFRYVHKSAQVHGGTIRLGPLKLIRVQSID